MLFGHNQHCPMIIIPYFQRYAIEIFKNKIFFFRKRYEIPLCFRDSARLRGLAVPLLACRAELTASLSDFPAIRGIPFENPRCGSET